MNSPFERIRLSYTSPKYLWSTVDDDVNRGIPQYTGAGVYHSIQGQGYTTVYRGRGIPQYTGAGVYHSICGILYEQVVNKHESCAHHGQRNACKR